MSTSLIPAAPAALSVNVQIQRLVPARVIDVLGQKTMWYFEKRAERETGNRDCAYISHVRGAKTFTMAYHPLDRNDQVVQDLPMEQLGKAVEDLIAAGFGSQSKLSHGLKAQTSYEQQPLKLTGAATQAAGTTICQVKPDTHVA